ncbi:MAG: hypothetical protein C7B45_10600 [Sulfobacillus acidophilus]|uniref:Uncharacterized protein n=1 Tax=Sulfobacillus acidophilus TaxID=53633 RepID=A0A2T2WGW9_9FIRM|nr:MAG: hypothetical protein C7B45_10600 [Sulfobacillus acidophilus]
MRSRDWMFAGFGLTLAIVGGVGEVRHDIALGIVAVVVGLVVWVICSGSRWIFDAACEAQLFALDRDQGLDPRLNVLEPVANVWFDPVDPS